MDRHFGDDDGETQVHARALEPAAEGSADAIFRSFVERSARVPAVPPDATTAPDLTPEEAMRLDELDEVQAMTGDEELAGAPSARFATRWTQTMEHLLQEADLHHHGARAEETRVGPSSDAILLLTERKGARALERDDEGDDDARTVAVRAVGLAERLLAARPAPPSEETVAVPRMPELVETVVHPSAEEDARSLDAHASGPWDEAERSSSTSGRWRTERERDPLPWESVVRAPSETTQRKEAQRLVPNVASLVVVEPPPSERSEDGLIPSGLLDRKLSDMAVLLRYGHEPQVRRELEHLRSRYSQDLLLARRIAEFYVTNERPALALEQLFSLATGLFERRNVEGMRQALEQVLVIDPANERATRLLALLEHRPSEIPPSPRGSSR